MTGPGGSRVLVIGTTGQVGREVVAALGQFRESFEVVGASRSDADVTRQVDLERPGTIEGLVHSVRPRHVILTAAATNVAWCQSHPVDSERINVMGTVAAARATRRVGATLTFISTDYVFDGCDGPYGEGHATHPINVYGDHKLRAEAAVLASDPRNLVVRTCQVFGDDPRRTNFVLRVVDELRARKMVTAAADLYGTPTYAPDLARLVSKLTVTGAAGIWHVAGETFLSRLQLAKMVASAFGGYPGLITEMKADEMGDPVPRPRRAGLRNERLATAGLSSLTPLQTALEQLAMRERNQA